MKAFDYLQRLQQMDQLIRLKATGSPRVFASRLGISKSSLYNHLDLLRMLGGPVKYNQQLSSFEYAYSVVLQLGYTKKWKSFLNVPVLLDWGIGVLPASCNCGLTRNHTIRSRARLPKSVKSRQWIQIFQIIWNSIFANGLCILRNGGICF